MTIKEGDLVKVLSCATWELTGGPIDAAKPHVGETFTVLEINTDGTRYKVNGWWYFANQLELYTPQRKQKVGSESRKVVVGGIIRVPNNATQGRDFLYMVESIEMGGEGVESIVYLKSLSRKFSIYHITPLPILEAALNNGGAEMYALTQE